MYRFQALSEVDIQQLTQCLNLSFSDYEQPIHFTPESLKYYLTASAVDLSLSFGAFCEDELVGVILNSSGIYNNQSVVFDAGTGVIPEFRGKKVFSSLFQYTSEQLRLNGVKKYYLEVLQSNHNAVSIYSKKGFSVQREYSVLIASGSQEGAKDAAAVVSYEAFTPFVLPYSVAPSFEHTTHTIDRNPHLYEVRYLNDQAYCVYAKRNGEIIQMHYQTLDALKVVMSAVACQYPSAMAKNVDCKNDDVIGLLQEIGFVEVLKQYEMAREI